MKSFDICRVSPASALLPEETVQKTLSKILPGSPIEDCSEPETKVVAQPGFHTLIAAADIAFADHYPLVLYPDLLWNTILQGFANHVNLNAEQYRNFFVSHEGKKKLEVRHDGLVREKMGNPWPEVFSMFSDKLRSEIGEANHKLLLADFSTTGPVEKAASEIALMDAMQSYFKYGVQTMCGIPSITLEGTEADWKTIHDKVEALRQFGGLDWWLDRVCVITQECLKSYQGNVDEIFWTSIYKEHGGSGGPYITGWLIHLLPYIKDWQTKKFSIQNPVVLEPNEGGAFFGVTHNYLPASVSSVPFVWNYFGTEFDYQFVAGVTAIEQNKETLALRPKMGWAVVPVNK